MSLEAIEKITQVEAENRERKAAAEAEAQRIVADALETRLKASLCSFKGDIQGQCFV